MFRVSKTEEPSRTIITVDGELSGDSTEVVETCCVQAISTGKHVHLFLRNVSTVDEAGRALLCRLAAKGIALRASGIYTCHLVQTINQSRAEPLDASNTLGSPSRKGTRREP